MRAVIERYLSLGSTSCICNLGQIDAAFFHLYGIGADDADYILETFPIVKRHDVEEFGEYRTKRVILERYGEYRRAMARENPAGFDLERELEKVMSAEAGQARTATWTKADKGARRSIPAKAEAGQAAVTGAQNSDRIPARAEVGPTAETNVYGVTGSLPPVPSPPTVENIVEYLGELGIRPENNRPKGGGLWVRQGKAEFGRVAEHLVKSGVGVRHYPEGTPKNPKECYEIDPGKRLG